MYCTATPTSHSFLLAEDLHILVSFIEEDGHPTAILPAKRAKNVTICDLKEGVVCQVEWSDKKLYSSRVLAIGE